MRIAAVIVTMIFGGAEATHSVRDPHAHDHEKGKTKVKSLCHTTRVSLTRKKELICD